LEATAEVGIEPNPLIRRRIEQRSLEVATHWYRSAGFEVQDVGNIKPYDLHCQRGPEDFRVEVKGTRGPGHAISLTDGEVRNALQAANYRVDLFVVSRIEVAVADGNVTATGGSHRLIEGWHPEPDRLAPTTYRYHLPREQS
jgi:hypothetical protein